MTIRTRFAPSPTGYLHIGGVRTALFSWAFAKKHKGEFLLRIEDTDLERSTAESVNAIFDGMHWVGLDYDNKDHVVYQTQNFDRYRQVIAQLLEQGHAYHCYCSKEELEAMREKAEKKAPPHMIAAGGRSRAKCCRRCPKAASRWCASKPRSKATLLGRIW